MVNAEASVERRPEEVGVSSARLARALAILDGWVDQDVVPGVAAVALRRGVVVARHFRGWAAPESGSGEARPIGPETIFPLSSATVPISATAFLTFVEAGEVLLDDPVARFVPEFGRLGKDQIRIRHLLGHTSGLPDMLPNNESLRKSHSGLPAFVRAAYRQEVGFTPGTQVSYSSTGILMLAEVAERIAKQPFADLLSERVSRPLGLRTAGLRPPEPTYGRIARLRLPEGRSSTDWDNNSPYWRRLAAPWGGAFATADDVARFGQFFLEACGFAGATWQAGPGLVLSPATARLMVQNHTRGLAVVGGLPDSWGLGWALPGARTSGWAGNLGSSDTFGIVGASGAMAWVDPARELVCVVLTNRITSWPIEYRRFALFSNALQAAVVG